MSQEKASAGRERACGGYDACERFGAELGKLLEQFAPSEEVRTHFRTAQVEFLKGLRAVIDARIDRGSAR
jgi:hypothetical protein